MPNLPHNPLAPVCAFCGTPISPHRYQQAGTCLRLDCQSAKWHASAVAQIQITQTAKQQAVSEVGRRMTAERDIAPEQLHVVQIPANCETLVNLPARRRRKLRDHVQRLVSNAAETPADGSDERKAESLPNVTRSAHDARAIGHACATCRGHCCRQGGEHAYLKVETLRGVFARNPELRPRDVLERYLECIPNKVVHHSCAYHGAQGCGLPSELRSETCNRFFCFELRELQREMPLDPAQALTVVAMNQTNVARITTLEPLPANLD